jgi:hypothetical protein
MERKVPNFGAQVRYQACLIYVCCMKLQETLDHRFSIKTDSTSEFW